MTAPETLWQSGFNLLNLANNHTLDYGPPAWLRPPSASAGRTAHCWSRPDIDAAYNPRIISIRGSRLAFLAFNTILPSSPEAEGWVRADWDEIRAVREWLLPPPRPMWSSC